MLEAPQDVKYCKECEASGAEVIIAPRFDEIITLVENADIVIFNWWAHPLSVDLLRNLSNVETRFIIWSHINGLRYPVLTAEFLDLFDEILLTSPCSVKNERFTEKQRRKLLLKTEFVYGIGDFNPKLLPYKDNYKIGITVRIGYVGTLDFAKLNISFPKICYEIKHQIPGAEFILCGKYSESFKNKYFAEFPTLKKCTEFTGFVGEPEKLLPTLDVFCYPLAENNYATTENALLEAMAAALPVIVLDNPAEREIVENGITGIVAESPNDFIDKTVELCKDETIRKRLGSAARTAIIKKYDVQVNADNFLKAVKSTLKTEKKLHNFKSLIGNDVWENFLYLCGKDKDKILRVINDEKIRLPDIFYSNSKGSPRHYYQYFNDKTLANLNERISNLK